MERNQDYYFDQSVPDFLFFDEPSNIESSATDVALRLILQGQQPPNQPTLREGKLYITVQGLSGVNTNLFLSFCRGFSCKVSMDNFSHTIPLQFPSHHPDNSKCLIFDVFEYFGPSTLKFTIQSRGLFVTEDLGTKSISLYDIFLLQEKKEASRNYLTTIGGEVKEEKCDVANSSVVNPIMPKKSYWGCDGIIHIDSKSGNSSASSISTARSGFRLSFQARFVQLHRSLTLGLFVHGGERYSELHHAAANGTVVIMKHLIESLGNKEALRTALSLRTTKGLSVLDISISLCNVDITKFLLQRVGNLCFQGIAKQTSCPLHYAVQSGEQEVLRMLLRFLHRYRTVIYLWEATSSLNDILDWKDDQDRTPLMLACNLGNNDMVQLLLKAGADPAVTTTISKRTALMFAAIQGSVNVCNTLLAETVAPTTAQKLLKGQQQVPLALLRCLPCASDNEGNQAIMHAAAHGHRNVVEALLLAKIPFSDCNNDGNNCFHIAATYGHEEVCKLLIVTEKKEWLDHVTHVSKASLNRMQYRSKYLMTKNTFGKRPLELARASCHYEIASLLEAAIKEIYGNTSAEQLTSNSTGNIDNDNTLPTSYGLYSTDKLTDFESDDIEYELALQSYSTKYDPNIFERDNPTETKKDRVESSKEQDETSTNTTARRGIDIGIAQKIASLNNRELSSAPFAMTLPNTPSKIKKTVRDNQSSNCSNDLLGSNNITNNKNDNNDNVVESRNT